MDHFWAQNPSLSFPPAWRAGRQTFKHSQVILIIKVRKHRLSLQTTQNGDEGTVILESLITQVTCDSRCHKEDVVEDRELESDPHPPCSQGCLQPASEELLPPLANENLVPPLPGSRAICLNYSRSPLKGGNSKEDASQLSQHDQSSSPPEPICTPPVSPDFPCGPAPESPHPPAATQLGASSKARSERTGTSLQRSRKGRQPDRSDRILRRTPPTGCGQHRGQPEWDKVSRVRIEDASAGRTWRVPSLAFFSSSLSARTFLRHSVTLLRPSFSFSAISLLKPISTWWAKGCESISHYFTFGPSSGKSLSRRSWRLRSTPGAGKDKRECVMFEGSGVRKSGKNNNIRGKQRLTRSSVLYKG